MTATPSQSKCDNYFTDDSNLRNLNETVESIVPNKKKGDPKIALEFDFLNQIILIIFIFILFDLI